MKTLASAQVKQEVLERLRTLHSESPRAWGKMTAPQMICHLSDAFRMIIAGKPVQMRDNPFTRTVVKWVALQAPLRWPHGIQGPPEVDQQIGGTPPRAFASDQIELVSLTEQFSVQTEHLASIKHPIFGKLTVEEWMRWGYLHMDHHLRQFGC